jgi:hypothetical protein
MHLFYIYCKIKSWIHGDDTSYELIKIVQVYGRWMMKIKHSFYENLSPLFERHEDMAIYSFLSFFLSFFFFTMLLSMYIFFIIIFFI